MSERYGHCFGVLVVIVIRSSHGGESITAGLLYSEIPISGGIEVLGQKGFSKRG